MIVSLGVANTHVAASTTLTLDTHSSDTTGWGVLLWVTCSAPTIPTGWTLHATLGPDPSDASGQRLSVLTLAPGSVPAVTLTQASAVYQAGVLIAFTGVASVAFPAAQVTTSTGSGTVTSARVAETDSDDYWLWATDTLVSDSSGATSWASAPSLAPITSDRVTLWVDSGAVGDRTFTSPGTSFAANVMHALPMRLLATAAASGASDVVGASDAVDGAPDLLAGADTTSSDIVTVTAVTVPSDITASTYETAKFGHAVVWQKFHVPAGTWTVTACYQPSAHGRSETSDQDDYDTYLYASVASSGSLTAVGLDANPNDPTASGLADPFTYNDDYHGGLSHLSWTDPGDRWIYLATRPYSDGDAMGPDLYLYLHLAGGNATTTAALTVTGSGMTATANPGSSQTATGTVVSGYTVNWGDGHANASTGTDLGTQSHTYTAAGTYTVTLTLTDSAGTASTATATFTATAPTTATGISGWDAEDSQSAAVRLGGLGPALVVIAAPSAAPATVQPRQLRKVTPTLGVRPALSGGRPVSTWHVEDVDDVAYGTPHLYIDGLDVTWWRDQPVRFSSLSWAEPFGDGPAEFAFTGVTPLDTPGAGDLSWLRAGAQAEVWVVLPDGTRAGAPWWCGFLLSEEPSYSATDASFTVQAAGALWQADQIRHVVPAVRAPTDIGTVIADALNAIPGRRYAHIAAPTTGITTAQRGSTSTEIGFVQELLATATTDDGATQWTVNRSGATPRQYAILAKDRTTAHLTMAVGTPGLQVDQLVRDATTAPNVIFGSGVGTDGYGWAGWTYPNLLPDTAPAYPYASAGTVMSLGSSDAGTVSGAGVTAWQRRAVAIGQTTRVDGTFSASDVAACRAIQKARGLTVDGAVGPQTWAATFDVGSNGGDLDGMRRMPLAYDPRVEPNLYTASGAIAGTNPAYDPTMLRIESDTSYGAGVSKAQGRRSAVAELARLGTAGWTGTLTLTLDPAQMSRFDVRPGMNVQLTGWAGTDVMLHIAGVTISDLGSVELTVDSLARDLVTLAAIITRDEETSADIARRPGKLSNASSTTNDVIVDFDGESGAGVIPRFAVYAGLWSVLRIPVAQVGSIAKLVFTTETPVTRFSLALFGVPITPADVERLVGDPLNDPDDASLAPYTRNLDVLNDTWGFIEAWGVGELGAGYYPLTADTDNPITGRLVETSTVEYVSQTPPWVWVAVYSPTSCFASGRLYPSQMSV